MRRALAISVGLSGLLHSVISISPGSVAVAAQTAAPATEPAALVLQSKVQAMGELAPWQKPIVESEVLPLHQAFIKSWGSGNVEVDAALLKSYLQFKCETDAAGKEPCNAWVVIRTERGCQKCENADEPLKKLAEARLARRGYTVQALSLEAIGLGGSEHALAGQGRAWPKDKEFEQSLLAAAARNGVRAVISLAVRRLPPDSPDDPHADELHFGVRAFMAARPAQAAQDETTLARPLESYSQFGEHLDYQVRDSVIPLAERLLTEATSKISEKLATGARAIGVSTGSVPGLKLELAGIRGFQHAARVMLPLDALIKAKNGAVWREKSFKRGRMTLDVHGISDRAGFETQLAGLVVGEDAFQEAPHFKIENLGADGYRLTLMPRAAPGSAGNTDQGVDQ